ncbi:hypothetical protein O181_099460 [Austropuccinia psidii MF-1]|uniref:Integrase catalytic domain-containing protein n=1 Tax=Austropuccinia psidii MF-1 TaxID=1389203 RepID=A0A9Q3PFW8_9BASI|nr:hypothetical protein [Austropuccinia psidii MF-1]
MIQIREPKSPLEIVHKDQVTALPPGGDKSFNACLVLVDRYSKTPMFLPFHKDDTAIIIWNRFISHTGLFQSIISDRDPKIHFSIVENSPYYHPQMDSLAKRMIQNLEEIIRTFCAYGLEFK